MKALLALLVCLPLAGCAQSPAGDAEVAHAGKSCEVGDIVTGFGPDGAPRCAVGFRCPSGLVGFDADGAPRCETNEAKTISLVSDGILLDEDKSYVVASGTPGMRWEQLQFTVEGQPWPHRAEAPCKGDIPGVGWVACNGSGVEAPSDTIVAGDSLRFAGVAGGQTLRVIDRDTHDAILTLTMA